MWVYVSETKWKKVVKKNVEYVENEIPNNERVIYIFFMAPWLLGIICSGVALVIFYDTQ